VLSRDKLRPINIADLPLDILRIILNEFHYDRVFSEWTTNGKLNWGFDCDRERPRTVQQLRLVSRLFCELASPLLLPILRIDIS
jgi:hypothetical protein